MNVSVPYWASQVELVVKNPSAKAEEVRDTRWIPGLRRSPGGGNGISLQNSCRENPMDWGGWQVTVHRVSKSQARVSKHTCTHKHTLET